ncbi:hypothetical protein EIP86_009638 [Pleurotus ostreatoroseus]|nr:hypothetical protein EIP86_009638 [Pleurotus ostreatoroseus]
MKYSSRFASLLLFVAGARAGTTIWSGSFNAYSTVTDFDNCVYPLDLTSFKLIMSPLGSWSNEVGEYQWYIHGSQPTSHYLALDPSFKNPADTSETNGIRMTIDSGATWNSQMERCELIPQTTANLGQGELFYHFSLMHDSTDPPESTLEHQIAFFESHFTELKYGVAPNATNIQWMVQGVAQWGLPFTAGTWFNFAYDINFSAGTVGLYASTGSDPLVRVVNNMAAPTSTNSEDWHVGVLRIVNDATPENFYFSGVYIEEGPITTAIGNGAAPPPVSSSSASSSAPTSPPSSVPPSSVPPTSTSSAPAGPLQSQYGQCGGKLPKYNNHA